MQELASELRRTPLLGTSVNRRQDVSKRRLLATKLSCQRRLDERHVGKPPGGDERMQQTISPAGQKVRQRPRRAEAHRSVGRLQAGEASEERRLSYCLPQDSFIGVVYERFLEMPVSVGFVRANALRAWDVAGWGGGLVLERCPRSS